MRHTLLRLISIAILILGLNGLLEFSIQGSKSAFACECIQPKETFEALNESKAVFSGRVVDIDIQPDYFNKIVTFDVDRAWKGVSNTEVTAMTGSDTGACGFPFELGKEYLVYSYDTSSGGESWIASICSRTAALPDAQEDLKVLGLGYIPTQNPVNVEKDNNVVDGSFPLIIGLGAAIAGFIAYWTLRKHNK